MTSRPKAESPYAEWVNSLGYLVRTAFRSVSRALENRTSRHGVTGSQWHFLRVLWMEDGISQRELSRRVRMREPTTVVALKRLEKSELVRREQSTQDRRRINVFLTLKAKRLKGKLMPLVDEVNELATKGFSEREKAELQRLLRKVNENLADEDVHADDPVRTP